MGPRTITKSSSSIDISDNIIVEPKIIGYTRDAKGKVMARHIKDEAGTIHTSTGSGGNTDQFVLTNELIKVGSLYENNSDAGRIYSDEGISTTIKSEGGGGGAKTGLYETQNRIRRLTPKECFFLMGFSEEFFNNAKDKNSDSQLYRQAGNSIVVNVLKSIIKNLIK